MRDATEYLDEIRQNLKKMRDQGQVTPAENALFGMLDGMAGLCLHMLEQMADMRRRIESLEAVAPDEYVAPPPPEHPLGGHAAS